MFSLITILFGFVVADSASSSFGTGVSLSVIQSIEASYSYEYPLSEDSIVHF